ncbi:MAG TPA: hypothetical protein VMT19_08840 [Thermoanaerobaculaceae bacterium]|nr:hypothetical protein [Thermoanaerobaculaceae bacterium]
MNRSLSLLNGDQEVLEKEERHLLLLHRAVGPPPDHVHHHEQVRVELLHLRPLPHVDDVLHHERVDAEPGRKAAERLL